MFGQDSNPLPPRGGQADVLGTLLLTEAFDNWEDGMEDEYS